MKKRSKLAEMLKEICKQVDEEQTEQTEAEEKREDEAIYGISRPKKIKHV